MTEQQIVSAVTELRHALHGIPELSGQEVKTKAMLKEFLTANTTLELKDCGEGFYAAYREAGAVEHIALRADYDALAMPDGTASHLCGHDGHAAALCGIALILEENRGKIGRDVYLLFQPAEETGAGAAVCCELFAMEQVDAVYGAHNLPGFPFGRVLTRFSTFACGSLGMTLKFTGKPTHAAYPELGVSPAMAVGRLLCELPDMVGRFADPTVRCTVIGAEMGEKAFGAAAEKAEVWLTLRAEHETQLRKLRAAVIDRAAELAAADGLAFGHGEQDVFPATENHDAHVRILMDKCGAALLDTPMRWSEDFGHYLLMKPGAFFGVGTGEDYPGLHTACYTYPDELLKPTMDAFRKLIL